VDKPVADKVAEVEVEAVHRVAVVGVLKAQSDRTVRIDLKLACLLRATYTAT
jgi:hypothetical protein